MGPSKESQLHSDLRKSQEFELLYRQIDCFYSLFASGTLRNFMTTCHRSEIFVVIVQVHGGWAFPLLYRYKIGRQVSDGIQVL